MDFFRVDQAAGHRVFVKTTDPRHISGADIPGHPAEEGEVTFQNMMFKALHGVNRLQQESDSLGVKMVIDPDSVDPHDITIAMAKANTALALTKAVIDRSVKAYTDILSIR